MGKANKFRADRLKQGFPVYGPDAFCGGLFDKEFRFNASFFALDGNSGEIADMLIRAG